LRTIERTGGFTITELLISVVVIMVGVLGFASSVGVSALEMWYGERDTEVAVLAAEQLERLRAQPYDSVSAGSRTDGRYSLDWQVEGADPKRVLLFVSYPSREGSTERDTLVAYVAR